MAIFLFTRWRSAAILDFDTGQIWRYATLRTVNIYRHTNFGDNISNGGRVITIFRLSKWRPAAILDFVVAQKWRHITLRAVHSYQRTNFGECISNGGRVMAIFIFSRWRPAAILDFDTGQKWRYCTLWTVNVYHRSKFCNCMSTGGWVIAFCGKKIKMAASAILNLRLAILDHQRSSLVALKQHRKFGVNRAFTFQDIAIFKFWKFGLKCLFRPPKFTFLFGFNT